MLLVLGQHVVNYEGQAQAPPLLQVTLDGTELDSVP